jgi:DNA-binding MarR family transcriptional regulator
MRPPDPALALESLLPAAMAILFVIPSDQDPLRNLPVGQIRLLRALLNGKQTATQLSRRLAMSPSALTQMCGRLISAGLVSKCPSTGDRRVRELELTELGAQCMSTRRRLRAESASSVLGRVPAAKTDALIGLLKEIIALDEAHVDVMEVVV